MLNFIQKNCITSRVLLCFAYNSMKTPNKCLYKS
ncbi:unnamed protein product [Brassica oleracea var. botrytis]